MTRIVRAKAKVTATATEDQEQIKLVTWLTKLGIRFYAIPNGGKRSFLAGVKLKRMGVSAGVPDLCIPVPTKTHHGLYIELKRVLGGRVSDNQTEWIDFLNNQGYCARVANGFEEATKIVCEYFGWA